MLARAQFYGAVLANAVSGVLHQIGQHLFDLRGIHADAHRRGRFQNKADIISAQLWLQKLLGFQKN